MGSAWICLPGSSLPGPSDCRLWKEDWGEAIPRALGADTNTLNLCDLIHHSQKVLTRGHRAHTPGSLGTRCQISHCRTSGSFVPGQIKKTVELFMVCYLWLGTQFDSAIDIKQLFSPATCNRECPQMSWQSWCHGWGCVPNRSHPVWHSAWHPGKCWLAWGRGGVQYSLHRSADGTPSKPG